MINPTAAVQNDTRYRLPDMINTRERRPSTWIVTGNVQWPQAANHVAGRLPGPSTGRPRKPFGLAELRTDEREAIKREGRPVPPTGYEADRDEAAVTA